jgi:hypothetical protein
MYHLFKLGGCLYVGPTTTLHGLSGLWARSLSTKGAHCFYKNWIPEKDYSGNSLGLFDIED